MVGTSDSMTLLIRLAAIILVALGPANGAKIDTINSCLKVKTICATSCCRVPIKCYVLNGGGGKTTIDVGAYWEAGVIWGFDGNSGSPSLGNSAKPQANLAEITIGDRSYPQQMHEQYFTGTYMEIVSYYTVGEPQIGHLHAE